MNMLFPGRPDYQGPTKGMFGLLHHEILCESSHDVMERVAYVKLNKPKNEAAVRLHNMIYLGGCDAAIDAAKVASLYAEYETKVASLDADYEAKVAPLCAEVLAYKPLKCGARVWIETTSDVITSDARKICRAFDAADERDSTEIGI